MRLSKLDAVTVVVFVALVAIEVYIKADEIFKAPLVILLGVILGFSMGFKLASFHSSQISRKALDLAETEEKKLSELETASTEIVDKLRKELERKNSMLAKLKNALKDRDEEVAHLVAELERLRKGQ
jgi:peptidoglycan hydrolase CwlO-like protein